jgi:hypothetical protein
MLLRTESVLIECAVYGIVLYRRLIYISCVLRYNCSRDGAFLPDIPYCQTISWKFTI